ncbi:hypothetical protein [Roseobacter litoralis]|uniref:hypothetical protein n=1 Tax=Roseobacter litoralis TaxID=42443 RepID=UPI00248F6DF2|nr:hypothetical protein [Roseobacter litoralis]
MLVGLVFIASRIILGTKGFTTLTGNPAYGPFLKLPRSFEAGLTALATVLVFGLLILILSVMIVSRHVDGTGRA